jgi:hypothetical protein
MVVALELAIVDPDRTRYERLAAWSKLVKIWAAMRTSDAASCPPMLFVFNESGLSGQITLSKTTGKGKKVGAIHWQISTEAYICVPDWLRKGWEIFVPLIDSRKCNLPLPSKDLDGFSDKAPDYSRSCAVNYKLMASCKKVMNSDHTGEVCQDSDLLFMDGVQGFWSGHSDRPTLTSWASILGHPGEHIEMIGRWSPSSSEEYIRTAKTTVLRLQASVAKAIREAGQEDILGEAALADQLDAYLTERGIPSELIFEQLTSLMAWHRINVSPEEEGNPGTPEVIQTVEPPEEADTEGTEIPAGSWVISLSNTGKVMTLHLVGSCWRVPGVHYRHFRTISMEAVAGDLRPNGEYNRVCRECFPGLPTSGNDEDGSSEGSATSSDGSSS